MPKTASGLVESAARKVHGCWVCGRSFGSEPNPDHTLGHIMLDALEKIADCQDDHAYMRVVARKAIREVTA